mmetsp:Transcript_108485/g.303832  ORF Transcript_108485/g.303832 Transcript_108485/m.303832 type:complete len:238 (-) Transcript_108485:76-789(-)
MASTALQTLSMGHMTGPSSIGVLMALSMHERRPKRWISEAGGGAMAVCIFSSWRPPEPLGDRRPAADPGFDVEGHAGDGGAARGLTDALDDGACTIKSSSSDTSKPRSHSHASRKVMSLTVISLRLLSTSWSSLLLSATRASNKKRTFPENPVCRQIRFKSGYGTAPVRSVSAARKAKATEPKVEMAQERKDATSRELGSSNSLMLIAPERFVSSARQMPATLPERRMRAHPALNSR